MFEVHKLKSLLAYDLNILTIPHAHNLLSYYLEGVKHILGLQSVYDNIDEPHSDHFCWNRKSLISICLGRRYAKWLVGEVNILRQKEIRDTKKKFVPQTTGNTI